MDVRIPPSVRPVLDDYVRLMTTRLPGFLEGLYLHGSLALGAFEPPLSDIDFIAVGARRCTPADIACLRSIHTELQRAYPHCLLEGAYLCWEDLGRLEAVPPHPYIHDGVLRPSGHHDINGVTWWVLSRRGIAVIGPAPNQLGIVVDWDALITAMRHNLQTYWANFAVAPERMVWLLSDYGVQWVVLGVLRQLYTFREHDITAKTDAGRYGLAHLPPRWHALIREALRIRAGAPQSLYRTCLLRALEAHAFLNVILVSCRTTHS